MLEAVESARAAGRVGLGPPAEPGDDAPTDLYHAVKPKPKAAPIADLAPSAPIAEKQAAEQARRARPKLWRWLGITALLASASAIALLQPRDPMAPVAGSHGGHDGDRDTLETPPASRSQPLRPPRAVGALERADEQAPALPDNAAGHVNVAFEQRGNAIVVPAKLRGPGGEVSGKMVFDTGATFCAISAATLARLGAPAGSAMSETETAAGIVRRPLTVLESVAVGTARVSGGLTVGVCDACASAGTLGLLGLNFSRNFVVTIDHQAGQLQLRPKAIANRTLYDIDPFVRLLRPQSARLRDSVVIRFALHNRSPRALHDVVIAATIEGADASPTTTVPFVGAGEEVGLTIESPAYRRHNIFTLELASARW